MGSLPGRERSPTRGFDWAQNERYRSVCVLDMADKACADDQATNSCRWRFQQVILQTPDAAEVIRMHDWKKSIPNPGFEEGARNKRYQDPKAFDEKGRPGGSHLNLTDV
jgi:hypothetical protein